MTSNPAQTVHARGQFEEVWVRFRKNKMAVIGMIILIVIVLLAIFADVLYDYETFCVKMNVPERGCPSVPRDIFSAQTPTVVICAPV